MSKAEATVTNDAAALLARMATRDESALREFYRQFHGQIYAFALKRLRDPADAADVLNEVMLEVWRSAGRFESRSKVSTWVLGITHHKAVDRLRRRKNRSYEELDDQIEDSDSPTAADVLAGAQDAALLRRCLDGLSDMHRQVMHLAYFEDLSCEEIAEISDCPVGTVKTRMFHARRLLKLCLEAQNPRAASNDSSGNPLRGT